MTDSNATELSKTYDALLQRAKAERKAESDMYPYRIAGECTSQLREHFGLGYIDMPMGGLQALCDTVAQICGKTYKMDDEGVAFYGR